MAIIRMVRDQKFVPKELLADFHLPRALIPLMTAAYHWPSAFIQLMPAVGIYPANSR